MLDRLRHVRVKPIEQAKARYAQFQDNRAKAFDEKVKKDIEKLEKEYEKERATTHLLEQKMDKEQALAKLRKRGGYAKKTAKTERKKYRVNEVQLAVNEIRKFQQGVSRVQPAPARRVPPQQSMFNLSFGIVDSLNVAKPTPPSSGAVSGRSLRDNMLDMFDANRW